MAFVVVRCEQDAWQLLEHCLALRTGDVPDQISFDGWPHLHVRLDPGDGRGSPEILKALALLQKAIYRAFALYKFGVPDTRFLSDEDKRELAPEWRIETGSTKIPISLTRAASHFMRTLTSRMTGPQQASTVLALGLIVCATTAFVGTLYFAADVEKERFKSQGQTEIALAGVEMTRLHTQQMLILKSAYERDQTMVLRHAAADIIDWRPALLNIAPIGGSITINGVVLDEKVAKAVASTLKSVAKEQRKQLGKTKPAVIEANWVTTVKSDKVLPPPMRLGV